MIIIPDNEYIEYNNSGRSLSKEFFCLSLKRKFEEIAKMEARGTIPQDYKLLDKLILAVLQHSPKSSIKEHPVSKERKIRPEAREADKLENSVESHACSALCKIGEELLSGDLSGVIEQSVPWQEYKESSDEPPKLLVKESEVPSLLISDNE